MAQTVLYNGILGNTPDRQGWLAYGTTFYPLPSAIQSAFSGYTNLNSPATGKGGYSNYKLLSPSVVNAAFPTLSRTNGYSLSFRLRLNSESHSSYDRAGFSITALSSDRQGIELGFWTNEIWAQRGGTGSTLFTHSPTERAFVSTTGWTNYDLLVVGDKYYLSANDRVILQGGLQNYTAFNSSGLPYDPYEQANFVFAGDNTSSAASNSDIASLIVNTANLGTASNDTILGASGDDLFNGLAGNDTLNGGPGNDILIGGDGNDLLNGGSGNDRLIGQAGNDSFLFDTGAVFTASAIGLDTLVDFTPTADRIVLDKTSFTALVSAVGSSLSASEFATVTTDVAVASSPARIVYNTSNGGLFYNQNGNLAGLGTGAQFATLLGNPAITAANFLIQA
jgi:Ca2+-binding RTX toxin-like protein